jgi:hypothetical protein
MRSDDRGVVVWERVSCDNCSRLVESDVLSEAQMVRALAWARTDSRLLCVACRRAAGRDIDLVGRILARI